MTGWVELPGGAKVRGRGRRDESEAVDFTLLLAAGPSNSPEQRRILWPDFWIPVDPADAFDALTETLNRIRQGQRVEIACNGGIGRTGTALAALAIMDGLPRSEAIGWVREHYRPNAVEMPWQRWWLRRIVAHPNQGA